MTGDAVAGNNDYIRVSMISVDEYRTFQSDFEHDSLEIRIAHFRSVGHSLCWLQMRI